MMNEQDPIPTRQRDITCHVRMQTLSLRNFLCTDGPLAFIVKHV
jgi:hypothetical protein